MFAVAMGCLFLIGSSDVPFKLSHLYHVVYLSALMHQTCVLIFVHMYVQRITTLPENLYRVRKTATRRIPPVEQGLLIIPENLSSPNVLVGLMLLNLLLGMFCRLFCSLCFCNCVVCPSIYGCLLPFWYLQTLCNQLHGY